MHALIPNHCERWGALRICALLQVMDEKVPRGSLTANQLLNWTNATQLKLFDRRIALKVEQDCALVLSRAVDLAKLSQENSFQMSQNCLIWKQNRAACKERLAAQRAQQMRAHPHNVSSVAPKQYLRKKRQLVQSVFSVYCFGARNETS